MSDRELTVDLMNEALLPASRERGYCLCIHPFMTVIDFSGTTCAWCEQPVTKRGWGPEAKAIRTEVVKAAYPWAVRDDD
jgi:hypothetical protein